MTEHKYICSECDTPCTLIQSLGPGKVDLCICPLGTNFGVPDWIHMGEVTEEIKTGIDLASEEPDRSEKLEVKLGDNPPGKVYLYRDEAMVHSLDIPTADFTGVVPGAGYSEPCCSHPKARFGESFTCSHIRGCSHCLLNKKNKAALIAYLKEKGVK